MKTLFTSALLVVMCLSPVAFGDALPDPEARGPYPVGVTTTLLSDISRTEASVEGPRPLMTEIWYPATDAAKDMPPNDMMNFFLKGTNPIVLAVVKQAFNSDLVEVQKTFENFAVRDAPIRDGQYPLVLFSHGNGGMRSQNVFWCEHLASHGYIVVSPDHTGNCCITTVDGNPIVYNLEGREQAAKDRPLDMKFLIDAMHSMNKGGDSRFHGRLNMEQIAVGGHSFGGFTSFAAAALDDRIKAIVPMAAVLSPDTNPECPSLVFVATEDVTIGEERNQEVRDFYASITAEKYMVEFVNAGHYSFSEMYQFNPEFGDGCGTGKRITNDEDITYIDMKTAYTLLNGYSTAFLGKLLKGQDGYTEYLNSNRNPDELTIQRGTAK